MTLSNAPGQGLLEALLDSWERNNTILVNLLRAIPKGGLETRAMASSPSIAELFTHMHYVRLVFVFEDAPEFARPMPEGEWVVEHEPGRIAQMLNDSARTLRDAVKGRLETGRDYGSTLRPPDSAAPAHGLARGLPPRSDQARPQDGGVPTRR